MDGFGETFKRWWSKPFSVDMTGGEWFLFIGLLAVIIILWNIILYRIVELVRATVWIIVAGGVIYSIATASTPMLA